MADNGFTSSFNPELFLDAQVSEPNAKRPPLPVENPEALDGTYLGIIKGIKPQSGIMEKGERAGQPWLSMMIPVHVEVPKRLQDELKLPAVVVLTDACFIDLTPTGAMDNSVGKNRRQRQYREALNFNNPGDVWTWRKPEGQPIRVKITHEIYNGEIQDRIGNILKV